MVLTVILVIVFLATLGFIAFINSRKAAREIERLNSRKK